MAKKTSNKTLPLPLYDELLKLDQDVFVSATAYDHPTYLTDNMVHTFRYYQEDALRFFHNSQTLPQFQYRHPKHVLFNMATGSGKTDLMAGLMLYLFYEHDYQNFLFVVNTNSVLNKTIDNLTNPQSDKYLFQQSIEIEGERIRIEKVSQFPRQPQENVIYLKLASIQSVFNDLFTQRENTMGLTDYSRHKVAVLGDEAHHYSASTKKEKEEEKSWERAIDLILAAHPDNRLLEFTATIDLDNKNVYAKYKDKIIYRYTLDRYISDRFSKNVKRIQSSNTDLDNMMNVILLSEFRRRFASEFYGSQIKPVILFKSPKIVDSNEAEAKFKELINQLSAEKVEDFIRFRSRISDDEQSETLSRAYQYYLANAEKLPQIVREMKRQFSPSRIINANDSDRGAGMLEKGQYEALNSLESPSNLYRVVFAVAKLTEGWDVLNLYDIVRISDTENAKGTKTSTMAEAQLIGRGARYNPFELEGEISYQRRFEDDSRDSLLLETLHYHTVNEPQYLKNLVAALNEMNLPTGEDKKNPLLDVKIKPSFKRTKLWKEGAIYYNEKVEVDDSYYDNLAKYGIDNQSDITINWKFTAKEVTYQSTQVYEDYRDTHTVAVELDRRFFVKAMNRLTFYHYSNLKKYLPQLESRDAFLGEQWLNISNRTLYAVVPAMFSGKDFTAEEKLEILEHYLMEVAKKIQTGYQKAIGTNKFIAYPIREYVSDYRKRVPNYDTGSMIFDNRPNPQQVSRHMIKEDFFVYDSTIVNLTEKQLIDRIAERVSELKEEYEHVYLIRMDENMHRESVKSDALKLYQFGEKVRERRFEAFQPDFILLMENTAHYLQIFIEPKGSNFLEKEQWKEDLLIYLNEHQADLVFEDQVEGLAIKGLRFYTMNDGRATMKQLSEIALGHNFKGLSYE
ncbi:DEAD/DEAH box helicase family protein [Facklamia lactis]|uniref:DEAD/DEAH box helicase family protein n=1 Tax=Facklamia lactis TaxID=2749967 RepID=UPI0018CDAF15|nr:DEAD/DEAH box helicase family protein [Facklamia lactis]MBG9980472.1 DEAD/DEAH box helicase family protein [Facklamia lactis]